MKKLVLCGCSLGESWMPYFDLAGYTNVTRSKEKWDTTRIQLGGGGHGVMVNGLLNHFLTNDISSTTVIAQFTAIDRRTVVVSDNFNKTLLDEGGYKTRLIENKITNKKEYILSDLSCRPAVLNTIASSLSGDYNVVNLISVLCMLSKLGADVYAFRGWQGLSTTAESVGSSRIARWDRIKKLLNDGNVTITDLDYLSECIKLSTTEEDWVDDTHPTEVLGTKGFDKIWKELNANK